MTQMPIRDRATASRVRTLGWLSLGLGLAQLVAPDAVRRLSGVDDSRTSRAVVPMVGARELLHAAGLLRGRRVGAWAWTRVAGDAMDLASLGVAMVHRTGSRRRRLAAVTGAVLGLTVLDVLTATRATHTDRAPGGGAAGRMQRSQKGRRLMDLTAATTIRRASSDVYGFWRTLENLPTFMAHLDEVRATGDKTSHWAANAPFGRTVEWDAEITEDVPEQLIRWRSTREADVPNAGTVRFKRAPDGFSTEVYVTMVYELPAGELGKLAAKYFGEEPHQQLEDDLRRLKQVLETGEVVRSDGAPWGKRARNEFPQRPAQPLSPEDLTKGAPL